ncbi:MAG: hypothetical protein D6790_18865 [Caldilineae bacterium]|nr:MAG: hypothetical protein D6790_18865 [Caldilineae bacterium]
MNTLFKFFIQVWVLWGVAAAVAVPRILSVGQRLRPVEDRSQQRAQRNVLRPTWTTVFALLLAASFAYPLWGLPARLDQRFPGWRPAFGTLNGLDFMRQGVYFWPDGNNPIELAYDWEAIQWLLKNTEGNLVIAESATLEYYRAGGSRVASTTGLSGLNGMHEGEQRYGDEVGQRNALLSELWNTPDPARMEQLIRELGIDLIYVGQLERHEHPAAVERLRTLAERGVLVQVYSNPKVIIYGVPDRLVLTEAGTLAPAPG